MNLKELHKTKEYKNFRKSFVVLFITGFCFISVLFLIVRNVIQPNVLYAYIFLPFLVVSTAVFCYHKDKFDDIREEINRKEIEKEIREQFWNDYKSGKYPELKIEVNGEDVKNG
jgi:hypothetical protein